VKVIEFQSFNELKNLDIQKKLIVATEHGILVTIKLGFLPNFLKLLNQLFIFGKCESHMCHAKDCNSPLKAQQLLDNGVFQ